MSNTIRVRAVEGRMLPLVNAAGETFQGAFVGYKMRKLPPGTKTLDAPPTWDIVTAGVDVPDAAYYRRAIDRGDLEIVQPRAAHTAPVSTGEVQK